MRASSSAVFVSCAVGGMGGVEGMDGVADTTELTPRGAGGVAVVADADESGPALRPLPPSRAPVLMKQAISPDKTPTTAPAKASASIWTRPASRS